MAKRRGGGRVTAKRPRGRTVLALAMVGFVLLAVGVILRRAAGVDQAREIRRLEQMREQRLATRDKLRADIRNASSRSVIQPIAESRLNMHVATDSQIVILRR